MSRHYPRNDFQRGPRRRRKRPVERRETTMQTTVRYGGLAVLAGLGIALGANAWDKHTARQAILAKLPAGYQFSGCNAVREMGLDPLYSYEPGYSERMDGDGDGIACEPYRGR